MGSYTWKSRLAVVAAAIVGICSIAPAPAWGQDSAGVYTHERLVRRFDFEEARYNNYEDLPMHWYAIGRPAQTSDAHFLRQPIHDQLIHQPGFPRFTTVRFDHPQHEPGEHRLYLGLNGGSAGAYLEVGALPVVPNGDYQITTAVRTTALKHARARLVVYFIDDRGRRIDESVVTSKLVQTQGQWQNLSVKLYGEHPRAAWLGLQVELLQPQQQPGPNALGIHSVVYQEIHGGAWFDDITVWQLPRVMVNTQNMANLIRAPQHPQLSMQVRDLTGQTLTVDTAIYDHLLRPVAKDRRLVGNGDPMKWQWQPPIKKFGWYLVDMKVADPAMANHRGGLGSSLIARTIGAFLWLPDEPALQPADAYRFSISAQDAPDEVLQLIPTLLDTSGVLSVVLSAWDRQTTLENMDQRQARLDDLIQLMIGRTQKVALSLYPVPNELAQALDIDPNLSLSMFQRSSRLWEPYLAPVLLRHGQHVRRWQLGTPKEADGFFINDIASLINSVSDEFRRLAPQPRLILPWEINQSRRPKISSSISYAMNVPPTVMPKAFSQHTKEWLSDPPADIELLLNTLPATQLAHPDRISDLALRMLYSWQAGQTGLSLPRPWVASADRQTSLLPDPLLGVFSSVAHRLAGRRVIGDLPLGPGLHCKILNGPAGASLVAWNESAKPQDAVIDMFLGLKPQTVDLWGNRHTVPMVNDKHHVELDSTPVFIEGIDPLLALFRASFSLRPGFIESVVAPRDGVIQFINPWPVTIRGQLRLTEPASWDISPRVYSFSIGAGQTFSLPIRVTIPVSEVAGHKKLVAQFDFIADKRYIVDVSTTTELGLSGVKFNATLALKKNPKTGHIDAIVTELITNNSTKTLAMYAFANLSGYPRQERIIAGLKPGQSTIHKFRFPDASLAIQTHNIRTGVRQTAGPAMINQILSAQDR